MKYFGTDGIRGHAFDTLPLLRAYQLGVAIKKHYKDYTCIIAHDTRLSSKDYVQAFLEGLNDSNYMYLAVVPTPVLAYETRVLNTIGLMITASHNPYYDNGFKLFFNGKKLSHDHLRLLESDMDTVTHYTMGDAIPLTQGNHHYHTLYDTFNFKAPLLKVLVDTAHGAASYLIKDYVDADIIFNKPDGYNINERCGATHMEALIAHMKGYDVGFSLDGDADRVLMVLGSKVIEGDELLYLIIKDYVTQGKHLKPSLSVMTNPGVIEAIERLGIHINPTPVGDHYILEAIDQGISDCGAEASGHIITPLHTIGDGIFGITVILDMIERHGLSTIHSWLSDIHKRPLITHNIKLSKSVLKHETVMSYLEHIKSQLKPYELFIVRASGTEDLIRITASKETNEEVLALIDETVAILKGAL